MLDSIQDYYDYLENDSSLVYDFSISKSLINLIKLNDKNDLKTICMYELYFNEYILANGELRPKITNTDGTSFPNFTLFDDDLHYIMSRAENTQNPKYKAKYLHLLWESPQKHHKYCTSAIDFYFLFLKNCQLPLKDNISFHSFKNLFFTIYNLSNRIKHRQNEILEYFLDNLGADKINGYNEYSIMKYILESKYRIELKTLKIFTDYCDKVISESKYPEILEEYIKLLIILHQKQGNATEQCHNQLAELYINQSKIHKESFVVHDFYFKAIEQYKLAGNKSKIEETAILIENVKHTINFKSITIEHTDENLNEIWMKITNMIDDLIDNYESKDIYSYIILSQNIFPKAKTLKQYLRPTMFDIVNVLTFDINRNIRRGEKSGINHYYTHIENFSLPHLTLIFKKGIESGKLSFESLLDFLKNHSWYGQELSIINGNDDQNKFNWIQLIAPSLEQFFFQSKIDIQSKKTNIQGYILCIDSLAIKFEGLLREFSRNIGSQTIEIKLNGLEERISFDKLLEDEKLNILIPEDDIAFFKFLFTSDGMNLRNNIAHCFYTQRKYSPAIMFLLISALLKLGNYKHKLKIEN